MSSSDAGSDRGLKYWVIVWAPVLAMITAIAIESTSWLGSDHTSGPLRTAWEFIFGRVSDAAWPAIHHTLRKTGHFVGYGLLGLTWLRAWRMTLAAGSFLRDALLAMAGTVLVASADEWHQTYLPNRTGRWQDVALDSSGAVVLLAGVWVVAQFRAHRRLPHAV
jgi:VanZ family protein